ncbi:MAG: 50S ribosomal protein L24 [Candidatus Aenigmatarchaeota archaeon]|nr:50S ribosomal protein L24 [Candidatus Aenigmarchaeota archaeon]
MRKKFSRKWISSKQPRKQRKYRYNAPLHIRHKLVSAHLSKKLREEYKRRAIPIRKGDKVRIMRGKYKGMQGSVIKVDLKKLKVYVDCAKRKKASGQEVHVPLDPSNLEIIELNLEDKKRLKRLKKKKEEENK